MNTAQIVVLGNANVDLTTYVPHAPGEGETVIGHGFGIGMGGKGANQAVAAARAGSKVAFIGRRGDDAFGDLIHSALNAEGLQLEHLVQVPGPSGNATIYVEDSGANRIAVFPGASATLTPESAKSSVAAQTGATHFVAPLEVSQDIVLAGLQEASAKGMTCVLNTAPFAPLIPGILEHTDWLIANEVEMEGLLRDVSLTADMNSPVEELLTFIPRWSSALRCNIVVTLGEQGAIGYVPGEEPCWYSTPPVTALDTVGAGDCFVGYFVAFLAQGLTWQQALAGGVIAASESVQRAGAQSSYPDLQQAASIRERATQHSG